MGDTQVDAVNGVRVPVVLQQLHDRIQQSPNFFRNGSKREAVAPGIRIRNYVLPLMRLLILLAVVAASGVGSGSRRDVRLDHPR